MKRSFLITLTLLLLYPVVSFSDTNPDPKKEKLLPKSGVLATVGAGLAGGGVSFNDAWGGVDMNSDTPSIPITGSITRTADNRWRVHVMNNSSDNYSVNVEFTQWDKASGRIGRESFSATLRKGGSEDMTYPVQPNAVGAQLFLKNWKNLSPPPKVTPTP